MMQSQKAIKTELISVIIPVYNAKGMLDTCVHSVINQTYRNWELILIDDGSTDGSANDCDNFALQDSRIKVVHKQNGGESSARNRGVEIASGDYITFVDADDFVHPQYLEFLFNAIKAGDYQISACLYEYPDETHPQQFHTQLLQNDYLKLCLSGRELLEGLFFRLKVRGFSFKTAWGKLYKTEVLKGHLYKDLYISADAEYASRMYQRISSMIIVGCPLYYWYRNPNSLSRAIFSYKNIHRMLCYYYAKNNIPVEDQKIRALGLKRLYLEMLYTREKASSNLKKQTTKVCGLINRKNFKEFLAHKEIPWRFKYYIILSLYSERFFERYRDKIMRSEKKSEQSMRKLKWE